MEQRCARNPIFGRPHKISTVDKYQGQQNDYILLSLVRTKAVGHLRDVRRLVVAMSRARLGLYIFARVSLFKNCYELQPAFSLLTRRPLQLQLAPWETVPCNRPNNQPPQGKPVVVKDVTHMSNLVHELYSDVCASINALVSLQAGPGAMTTHELPPDTGARYDSDEEVAAETDDAEESVMIVNEIDDK